MNGIILVDKKAGMSSNKVVNKVKHFLSANKAGHLGTLDLQGEGLLPVTINKGTKVFDYFLSKDKVYRTIFQFGVLTDTLDLEGEITQTDENANISGQDIEKIIPDFIGKQSQMPPVYSAKKINGKTAYSLVRAGKEVALKPKDIEIYNISLIKQLDKNIFEFVVHCSAGTYIRSLARDMGEKLGTYGIMRYIQRTKCGMFSLEDASTLEQIENGDYKLILLDKIFEDYDSIKLSREHSQKLLNGQELTCQNSGTMRVYNEDNKFLGLGQVKDNRLKLSLRLI